MAIPLRNIYYLLCYAWGRLEARDLAPVGADLGDRVESLLGHVIAEGVGRLTRQGLDHGYVGHDVELAGLKGKLLVGESVKRSLFASGRTACHVDELTPDVPHNRVVKAAMRWLAACDEVDLALRGRLRRLLDHFTAVADVALEPSAFRSVQLHRNIARYGLLLDVCALLCRCLVPDPRTGERRFHPFTASDQAMGRLFEDFLYGYYQREQSALKVARRTFDWAASVEDPRDLAWLPELRTDLLLTGPSRRIVIEAKFYRQPLVRSRPGAQPKLISGHLYQLLAYLERLREPERPAPEGILLYARADEPFDLRYTLAGHRVRVLTLDLDQPWPGIAEDLHRVLLPAEGRGARP